MGLSDDSFIMKVLNSLSRWGHHSSMRWSHSMLNMKMYAQLWSVKVCLHLFFFTAEASLASRLSSVTVHVSFLCMSILLHWWCPSFPLIFSLSVSPLSSYLYIHHTSLVFLWSAILPCAQKYELQCNAVIEFEYTEYEPMYVATYVWCSYGQQPFNTLVWCSLKFSPTSNDTSGGRRGWTQFVLCADH